MSLPHEFSIEVETHYLSAQSDIELSQFMFSYTISIINTGALPAQLISRYWSITNGDGEVKEVKGLGVVGEQPTILPSQCYRYTSGVMFSTPFGTMQGTYQMMANDGHLFDISIPVFRLAIPELIN